MKSYTVLAASMTGARNKHLKEGGIYLEHDFVNIDAHIKAGDIKEYVPVDEKPVSKKEDPAKANS